VTPRSDFYPIDQLYEQLTSESASEKRVKRADLVTHADVRGLVVWVDIGASESPAEWIKFIESYAESLKRLEPDAPLLFIGVLQGDPANGAINEETHLSMRDWRHVIRVIDVRTVVEQELRKRNFNPTQHQLAVETIARVALWDLELASELTSYSLAEITDPFDVLEDYAQKREWSVHQEPRWEDGTCGQFFGELQTHSALCMLQGNLQVVERRVWAAQTGVVLPFLEARLRTLIDRLNCLPPTWSTNSGEHRIVNRENYELRHVAEILSEDGVSSGLTHMVRRFKDIRNRIAHLESLRPADLDHLSLKRFNTTLDDR
jgi:hypothetical protein